MVGAFDENKSFRAIRQCIERVRFHIPRYYILFTVDDKQRLVILLYGARYIKLKKLIIELLVQSLSVHPMLRASVDDMPLLPEFIHLIIGKIVSRGIRQIMDGASEDYFINAPVAVGIERSIYRPGRMSDEHKFFEFVGGREK